MDFTHFAKSRKSARGFLDKPVPKQVVDDILATAKWAPSSYNTQTWRVHAVTGETLDRIREGNTKNTLEGKPHVRDFPYKEEYEGEHRKRQIDVAIQLFEAMGIARDDKEKRLDWMLRGFRQFDAPVSLVLTYNKYLEPAALASSRSGRSPTALFSPPGSASWAALSMVRALCSRMSCATWPAFRTMKAL